ncbi:MAG: RNA 3'-terminal phosphate cyclase [Patescibacteria group bacterium]
MLRINGSYGEGGGQILRTSLSLSVLTGQPIEIFNIRAKRKNPGLQRQHLVCVEACQKISGAKVFGAKIGSQILRFEPKKIKQGKYEFDIGTAGSTSLVIQTILLPLAFAHQPSEILLIGGTHNPWAPPFHYLKEVFLSMVKQLGIRAGVSLERWGFYPKGGGRVRLFIQPTAKLTAKNFLNRGELKEFSGLSVVANLPIEIAERQKNSVIKYLQRLRSYSREYDQRQLAENIVVESVKTNSPGTFVFLKAYFANDIFAGFSALGERGKPAEKVAEEAAKQFVDFYQSKKCLDPYLADQIVLYLALNKQPFAFTVSKITNHLLTHIWLLEQFLGLKINIDLKENKIGRTGTAGRV